MSWRCSAGAVLGVALAACGGSDPGGGGPTPATALLVSRAGGDQQQGPAGTQLPVPLIVLVTDSGGTRQAGREVDWQVASGDGTLDSARTVTGADGTAATTLRLGATPGAVQVSARTRTLDDLGGVETSFSLSALPSAAIVKLHEEPIPANYGIHDQFVRDGLAFVSAWNTGLQIWDVGNGMKGGSPSHPVFVSGIVPTTGPSGVSGAIHNSWWFHNPNTGEKRYVFVGQEGPGSVGASSSGDIYVVDVADLAHPRQVATFRLPGAGTHNFWMDEPAQVLYAAYYDGGVVAIDVSGTLSGDLSSRMLAHVTPGGAGQTFVWGVQLYQGSLYAIDMVSGLWQLAPVSGGLATVKGGFNVPARWSSDLWLHGGVAYTGTWGGIARNGNPGNTLEVWDLSNRLSVPVDSVVLPGVGTVSDVEVAADGKLLLATAERGSRAGAYVFTLADPLHPQLAGSLMVPDGLHTGTFAVIGGRRYVFAARNPGSPALVTFDVTAAVP